VRRDLGEAGFTVHRRPGFGAKRERLEARLPERPPSRAPGRPPRVAIVGAGIAGAALTRAFRSLGIEAAVIEAAGPGAGASGAPAALAAPRLDAGLGPQAALFAQAMRRAASLFAETPSVIIARQALQLGIASKDPARFAAIAASDLFEPGAMRRLDSEAMATALGEASPSGLWIDQALVLDPKLVLKAWLGETTRARVATARPHEDGWRLADAAGETILQADVVCLAAAMGCTQLAPELVLTAVRGQASCITDLAWPMATMFGGYVIATPAGVMFGATHDRGDSGLETRGADHARNLDAVRQTLPRLAERLAGARLEAWTAIRATTSDYLPLAGAVPESPRGLFALTGLGSRGFCLAPLLAEHVAAMAMQVPSPLPRTLADLVDPARFAVRASRKGRPVRPRPDAA
jgi:tRNA 5-methylaminomethyl-2-thiouridine biosynthesis bifunctional protein